MSITKNKNIIIKGGKIFTATGPKLADILIEDGQVKKIFQSPLQKKEEIGTDHTLPDESIEIIDAGGMMIIPSLVDMHVHLREPGFSYKETIKSGSEAAAAGGFTTVCPMPNLNPAPDSLPSLQKQLDLINKDAVIDVLPFATITKGRRGHELADYETLAPFVAGFSDDGTGVQSTEVMREAMRGIAKTGKILAAHCEVEELLKGGYIHDGEYAHINKHKGISSESEWKEVERDIRLAEETGCRLHICHISTKESVELVRKAKAKGLKVTCETAPHYLTFTDQDLQEDGRFKMNPPIRSYPDREALREGIADGTIDVIATDHAPHSAEEKNRGLEKSAMGVVGLETAFAAAYTSMVASGLISLERLIEVMAIKPREILGLPVISEVKEGVPANLTLINPEEKFIVDPSQFKTAGRATPYQGMELQGKIKMTINRGKIVYTSL